MTRILTDVALILAAVVAVLFFWSLPSRAGWPEAEFAYERRIQLKLGKRSKARPVPTTFRKRVMPPRRDDDEFKGRECKPVVEGIGRDALTDPGAKANAERAWQERVRFKYGELYADPINAAAITKACVSSSIRNAVNRATEAIGLDTQKHRCSMIATPCAAPKLGEGK